MTERKKVNLPTLFNKAKKGEPLKDMELTILIFLVNVGHIQYQRF